MKNSSKKGQVQTLGPTMIVLVLASIMLVFGLIISQSLRDTDVINQAATTTTTNETVTTVNEVAQSVANSGDRGANSFSLTTAYNATGGEVITSANYTFSTTGTIVAAAGSEYNNSNWNLTYTYLHGDEAWTASNDTIDGLGTFADFWEIIVLAIVITIVIGLLLMTFGGSRRR